jgi:hypothetical protein
MNMRLIPIIIILITTIFKYTNTKCETTAIWRPNLSPTYIYTQTWTSNLKKHILSKSNKNNCHLSCILNLVLMSAGDIQTNPGPQHRNRTVNPCGLWKGLSLGPAREYAVTIAASGTTDHVLNFVPMIMNYYNDQTYNGCATNVNP